MKVYFISNGVWEFDGRLRELIKVASELGEIKYITRVKNSDLAVSENHIKVRDNNYLKFICKAVYEGLRYKNIDILFVDNRKAIIPALMLNLFLRPRKVILDVRELYLSKEVKHLAGKIGCFFEGVLIKKADIVICANEWRSKIMKDYYKLDVLPIVFENIRRIKKIDKINNSEIAAKYEHIFAKKTYKIISTSGFSVSRTNDKLVNSMTLLGNEFDLLLVGGGNNHDFKVIMNIIENNNLSNVHLIDMVSEAELSYLIHNSHIGVVNYHQNDSNNKYCASGKIYEFLFAELPVITTENLPLVDIVKENNIGEFDNDYYKGILKIQSNYFEYKKNVKNYVSNIDDNKNINQLKTNIIKQAFDKSDKTVSR